ncbi:hydroxyacid dehydrogenase [Mycolicibacterium elephantis]|uniref:Hydroxyacid dehydrogenase n=1 Tax=Mycolicibacterium elephantis TaxID=81858 RepID=A0A1X0D8L4_9MYCO|nr:phosphoglycerate dehydrogenase [Mycolicibacterium elephantis]ORA68756.1 hydroxyacid dehydrogenase [Mycolicibacterium elephantis]
MQNALPRHRKRIEDAGYGLVVPEVKGQRLDSDELVAVAHDCVGLVAGDDDLGRQTLAALPKLKVLVRWGIGTDTVDFDAARELGVVVRNTPGVFGDEVADSAFGYILNLARGHHLIDAAVRRGEWKKLEGITLAGETLGVVGAGSIGSAVLRRGLGFGMSVFACDPYFQGELPRGATLIELDDLLQRSRFIVLTAPSNTSTRGMINALTLAKMRPDAFLVNVARGDLVIENDLIAALESGALAGAGLDVYEVEPLPTGSALRRLNVVLGSHNGSNATAGVMRASQRAVDILLEELGHT